MQVRHLASRLMRQPQTLWLRRALFQVHLWTGLAISLYVLVICLSGSGIVLRREMDLALCPKLIRVEPSGPRLSEAQLIAAAREALQRRLPGDSPRIEVRGPRVPGAAVEVWYFRGGNRMERLLDPYTGKDLGDAVDCEPAWVSRLAELHDELLGGRTGRTVNGFGAALVTLLCLTGAVIWWPGVSRWKRALSLRLGPWRRFVWDLHSALGFWMLIPILMWAVSGLYMGFPGEISALEDLMVTHGGPAVAQRIDTFTEWLVALHFGRAFGGWIKVLWVILGVVPVVLLVTGVLMWVNRVLRRNRSRENVPGSA